VARAPHRSARCFTDVIEKIAESPACIKVQHMLQGDCSTHIYMQYDNYQEGVKRGKEDNLDHNSAVYHALEVKTLHTIPQTRATLPAVPVMSENFPTRMA
jgi:hypothetical protein